MTGIEFGVRGRGWAELITWDTGEASYQAFAAVWAEASGIGGSPRTPAARRMYNTNSTASVPVPIPPGDSISHMRGLGRDEDPATEG